MSVNTPTAPPFTLIDTPLIGLEDVQRAAFYVFFEGLNNALTEISSYWLTRDQEYDSRVGTSLAPTDLEEVPNANFHEGHKPSLIKGAPEDYPNIAVFATRADPGPEDRAFDQMDQWTDSLLVEVMVKALDEDTVNRRIHRMVEAAALCIRRNKTLGGAVSDTTATPRVNITDVFAVRSPSQSGGYQAQDGTGSRYVWQAASLNFGVVKDSVLPSSGAGTFASSSQVDYGQYIDQG